MQIIEENHTVKPPSFSGWILRVAAWLVGGLALLPLGYLIVRAMGTGREFLPVLMRPRSLSVLSNTLLLTFSVTFSATLVGVLLGWLTARTDLPGRRYWLVATVLPLVLPSYVGAFALIAALGPQGMLQQVLSPLGIARLPSIYGFGGAWLALTLFTYPYVLLSVRAGLRGLDPSIENAARSLGRDARQTFWSIIMPHLRPAVAAGALLVALYTLSDFGAVALLQFNAFTREIYVQYTGALDRSAAAVLALVLVLITLVVLALEYRTRGHARYHRSSAGTPRHATIVPLGPWRYPALIFCTLTALLALGVPLMVTLYWLVQTTMGDQAWSTVWEMTLNSITVSGFAAMACVVAALPVVLYSTRYPSTASRWTERSIYLGYALPGIVVALSLVFFGARFATGLYQTLPLLILAYVLLFLPLAAGALRSVMLHISPRLEEASRTLGHSARQTLLDVTLPLLRPGLLTGAALVFLTCMKELPATLLLGPTGYPTLATRIWAATDEALFARAAAPALLLMLISALSIWIMLKNDES